MPLGRPLTLDTSVYYRDNSDAMRVALDMTMGRNAALYGSVNTYVPPGHRRRWESSDENDE